MIISYGGEERNLIYVNRVILSLCHSSGWSIDFKVTKGAVLLPMLSCDSADETFYLANRINALIEKKDLFGDRVFTIPKYSPEVDKPYVPEVGDMVKVAHDIEFSCWEILSIKGQGAEIWNRETTISPRYVTVSSLSLVARPVNPAPYVPEVGDVINVHGIDALETERRVVTAVDLAKGIVQYEVMDGQRVKVTAYWDLIKTISLVERPVKPVKFEVGDIVETKDGLTWIVSCIPDDGVFLIHPSMILPDGTIAGSPYIWERNHELKFVKKADSLIQDIIRKLVKDGMKKKLLRLKEELKPQDKPTSSDVRLINSPKTFCIGHGNRVIDIKEGMEVKSTTTVRKGKTYCRITLQSSSETDPSESCDFSTAEEMNKVMDAIVMFIERGVINV